MRPDVAAVRDFLSRAARRLTLVSGARGAAIGLAIALVLALFGWPDRDAIVSVVALGVAACVLGATISIFISREQRRQVALLVEKRAPSSRNLIVTAHELSLRPADGYVPNLVFAEAASLVRRLDTAELFPARNALIGSLAVLALWIVVVARPGLPVPAALGGVGAIAGANGVPTIDHIEITLEPPAYTGRAMSRLRDPSRIEALAGSRITVAVRARAERIAMETLTSHEALVKRGSDFVGTIAADADGYVALQPTMHDRPGARRLIGITVIPDSPPRVRITAPGHDLRFPDGHRTIDIAIDAGDDIGLASLALRFTKVSGSGERFTFVEKELPLAVVRRDDRTWTAHGKLNLDSLKLDPGDMVVYRAIAADGRLKGGTTESDSYIAEILAPGGVAAPGFAVDPEQDRYAVSQQMVILKTERLLARVSSMPADSLTGAAQDIAAEQRKVRAEFVFMLGGELEDAPDVNASMTDLNETQEAEGESDILAGRNANAGHVALLRAIRAMSRAAASLAVGEPTTALPYERAALTALESAFSRSRILLRALTTRERLDLSRRLTGITADAVRDVEPSAAPAEGSRTAALRLELSDVAALAGSRVFGSEDAARASALAERTLRVDASDKELQEVSSQLARAAAAMGQHRDDAARTALDDASVGIVTVLRGALLASPMTAPSENESRVRGALTDALRSSAGRPR